jgi:hypothetical protein
MFFSRTMYESISDFVFLGLLSSHATRSCNLFGKLLNLLNPLNY